MRAILSVHLCGTWQSGHLARTPERLLKWIVPFSSSKTLVHLVAGGAERSVLVASSTVLNPPQKKTPAIKPPSVRKARLRVRAGGRLAQPVADARWPKAP